VERSCASIRPLLRQLRGATSGVWFEEVGYFENFLPNLYRRESRRQQAESAV
jgi:hypothetical protein